jgi:sugar/nucleoside kinase (ribokinase family)
VLVLQRPLATGDHNVARTIFSVGGTAAIVAHNVAALGGAPSFAGHVGLSLADQEAVGQLEHAGVKVTATVATPIGLRVTVVVEPTGRRTLIASGPTPDWSRLRPLFSADDIVFFEGWHVYDPSTRDAYCELVGRAAEVGATIVMDLCSADRVNDDDKDLLKSLPLDVVLGNGREAEAFGLLAERTDRVVVVHRGRDSTLLYSAEGTREYGHAHLKPVDTTGAGDTFAAGLLLALSRGADVGEAVHKGHEAALAVIQVFGALLPNRLGTEAADDVRDLSAG